MKLNIFATLRGPEICLNPGDVYETENRELAKTLIAAGVAEEIKETPVEVPAEVAEEVPVTPAEEVKEEEPKIEESKKGRK